MTGIPNDPFILMSWANTKLRDEYQSLAALCDDLQLDMTEIRTKLDAVGFKYNEELNQFR